MKDTSKAREAFANAGLTYADITNKDIGILIRFLNEEFEKMPNNSIKLRVAKKKKTKINFDADFNIESCFIFCDGSYFDGREAISFNSDGFIGFAGWSDSKNIIPFIDAFCRWIEIKRNYKNAIDSRLSKE